MGLILVFDHVIVETISFLNETMPNNILTTEVEIYCIKTLTV